MTNNTIYANDGSFGNMRQGNVGSIMQGASGMALTFTLNDIGGTAVDLTGYTITGRMRSIPGAVTAVAGALAVTASAASGEFTWTVDAADTGANGGYTVWFTFTKLSSPTYVSFPSPIEIVNNPAVDSVSAAALVGVSVEEASWLGTAVTNIQAGTSGNFAGIDANGNLVDSGSAAADFGGGGASDVGDLTTTGLTAANMLRVAAAGGLEERTPANVLSDIGVAAAALTLTNKTVIDFSNDIDADDVHVQIRNESGDTLAVGTPVYASGFNVGLDIILVSKADASSAATMPAMALVAEEILNNATGKGIIIGRIENVNTSAFSAGDELYVSETAGALTATKPTGTALIQSVATVLRVHATAGVLQVSSSFSEDLPNLPENQMWYGDSNGVPTAGDAATIRTAIGALPEDAGIVAVSAGRDLAASDAGQLLECNGTFTLNAPDGLDAGFQCALVNVGVGIITISATTTLQAKGAAYTLANQYGMGTIYHRGSNVWLLAGDLT